MTITGRRKLEPGDVLLACSDGLWGALDDEAISRPWTKAGETLGDALTALSKRAVAAAGPGADNTTGVVLRWLGPS
jgi:serine/threonine protein phosphatase PrpC